jgi:response regulator RpfG family c-di-GMP phosphodiesterase
MKTVLIVDDHADNRSVLIAMLAHRGHRLIESEKGRQGGSNGENYVVPLWSPDHQKSRVRERKAAGKQNHSRV